MFYMGVSKKNGGSTKIEGKPMGLLGKPTILGKPHIKPPEKPHIQSPPHAHVPQYCGQQAIDRETPPAGNNVSNGNKTLIRHFIFIQDTWTFSMQNVCPNW